MIWSVSLLRYCLCVNNTQTSGAFQLAVWEIANETAASYSLDSGNFMVGSASNEAYDKANEWLNNLNNGTFSADTMTLSVWKDVEGRTQDLAVFTAPVPEPEIYAMLGVGLGLLGWVGRRKKLQAA